MLSKTEIDTRYVAYTVFQQLQFFFQKRGKLKEDSQDDHPIGIKNNKNEEFMKVSWETKRNIAHKRVQGHGNRVDATWERSYIMSINIEKQTSVQGIKLQTMKMKTSKPIV